MFDDEKRGIALGKNRTLAACRREGVARTEAYRQSAAIRLLTQVPHPPVISLLIGMNTRNPIQPMYPHLTCRILRPN